MGQNRWNLCFAISIMLHGLLLFSVPAWLMYRHTSRPKPSQIQLVPERMEKIRKPDIDDFFSKKPPAYIDNIVKKTILDSSAQSSLEKPEIEAPAPHIELVLQKPKAADDGGRLKETVLASQRDQRIEETPAYMDYYRAVREKIRSTAHRYYDYTDKGVVNISFIIRQDGNLSGLDLMDQVQTNKRLIQLAYRSVNDAAPFPSFPKELDYSQLQFNLSIHFKNN